MTTEGRLGPEIGPSPEALSRYWQEFWQTGEEVQRDFDVSSLRLGQDGISAIYGTGGKIVYVPKEAEDLELLNELFPRMQIAKVLARFSFVDVSRSSGYLRIEDSISAPNLNTKEGELRKIIKSQGAEGMSLQTYIVAAWDSVLRTGHELDWVNTWTRLTGTEVSGRPVFATLRSFHLLVDSHLGAHHNMYFLGGRSQRRI